MRPGRRAWHVADGYVPGPRDVPELVAEVREHLDALTTIALAAGLGADATAEEVAARVGEMARTLSLIGTWRHEHGAALKPSRADTYGDGMRDASIEDRPHDPAHLTFDAFVATTQQRHGQQSDADAAHIAHAHPGRVRAWLGAVARLRERAAEGHALECGAHQERGRGRFYACTCGHDLDLAALAAVDAEG